MGLKQVDNSYHDEKVFKQNQRYEYRKVHGLQSFAGKRFDDPIVNKKNQSIDLFKGVYSRKYWKGDEKSRQKAMSGEIDIHGRIFLSAFEI